MKRTGWIGVIGLCGLFFLAGAAAQEKIHFAVHGFTIAPLESDEVGATGQLLSMFLPASDGFAPNVNVLAQATPLSIDDYLSVSKQQFEQMKFQMITAEKKGDDTAIFEYTGKLEGASDEVKDVTFHWYSKAIKKGPRILLATATATDKQWPDDSAKLKACIDAFTADAAK